MNPFRRIESRVGRAAMLVLLFILGIVIVSIPVGILGASNLVWGEDNQYGRVDIPGTATLHLPSGVVRVSVAVDVVGRGNQTPDLPFPDNLSLSVTATGDTGQPVVRQEVGDTNNANDDLDNTQRQAWTVQIPGSGDYRVKAQGDFTSIGVNPQLWFGHGPPLPGTLVPVIAAGITAIGFLVWLLVIPAVRGKSRPRVPSLGDLSSGGGFEG